MSPPGFTFVPVVAPPLTTVVALVDVLGALVVLGALSPVGLSLLLLREGARALLRGGGEGGFRGGDITTTSLAMSRFSAGDSAL